MGTCISSKKRISQPNSDYSEYPEDINLYASSIKVGATSAKYNALLSNIRIVNFPKVRIVLTKERSFDEILNRWCYRGISAQKIQAL